MTVTVTKYSRRRQRWDTRERNAAFLKRHGREMGYEDVIRAFGGRFTGASIVEPWQQNGRTVLREGENL